MSKKRNIIKYKDYIELELAWWEYSKIDYEDYEKIKNYSWYKSKRQSVESRINYKLIKIHHIIKWKPLKWYVIDHINWDTLDNRKNNLRVCTIQQNIWNSKLSKNNTSWYSHIRFNEKNNNRIVKITNNKKEIARRFKELNEAIKYKDKILKELRWNFNRNYITT